MKAAETLCNIDDPSLTQCDSEAQKDLVNTINLKETSATLKEASKGKAPGPEKLPIEAPK
ncbi:hypothetical protein DSO57_1023596 [Entomophthora muscae]|uniref:Uncharacterized protein n=1 Tax=Entomophthora muscae TaxID=34485 RepID=A0ACC2SSH8_9FUNG|nr:hypothetical protein DSO57_1023596 [Entomophthora muscae]